MYFPSDKMKVNLFKQVAIPSNAEYFARYGFAVSPASAYTGDETAPQPMNKGELIEDMVAYDKLMQEKENSKTE